MDLLLLLYHQDRDQKIMMDKEKHPQFGKHWYHNPETYENVICLPNEMPIGYIKGKSPKTREVK